MRKPDDKKPPHAMPVKPKPTGILAALKKKLGTADSEEGEPVADDERAEMKKRGR